MPDLSAAAVVLTACMAIACVTDTLSHRIPNALTFPMMALGLAIQGSAGTLSAGGAGLMAAFAIWYTLAVLGIMAAGDGKLMMGVGALTTWAFVVEATLAALILYIPIGLVVLGVRGRLPNLVAAMKWTLRKAQGVEAGPRPEPTRAPHAIVLAIGTATAWFTDLFHFVG